MSSDDSEDAFEPSPLPTKRRRLNPTVGVCQSESEDDRLQTVSKRTRKRSAAHKVTPDTTDEEQRLPKKAPKPKHLIHIIANPVDLEDQFYTQAPDPVSSSPWRIRGARWQKPPKPAHDPLPSRHSSGETTNPKEIASLRDVHNTQNDHPVEECRIVGPEERLFKRGGSLSQSRSGSRSRLTNRGPSEESPRDALLPAFDFARELEELPSDAFVSSSSSPQKSPAAASHETIVISSQQRLSPADRPNLVAPRNGLHQMTLFGGAAQQGLTAEPAGKKRNWPLARKEEPPTHHKLDSEALKTYVYPTNLGKIRDYQFSIVKRGLYHNLLVALPTGLGKTFIAATVMLNWWRWTKDAQIVFVAPTRPLVSQQVEACFGIAGIPRSQTSMLTGTIPPGLRAEEWASKRVFFTTPQTIANDLKTGICDPKRLVLLVVDEAHRATGNYSYVDVVRFLRRFNQSFRVLALTATPGASIEAVQEVINGLHISRIEIRTEFSIDIREYVYSRKTEVMTFDNSEEMERVMELFSKALSPLVQQLRAQNSYWTADPMMLSAYGLTQARQRWMGQAGKNANPGLKAMINRIFTVLASLAHSIELLKYHGIGPFYHNVLAFQNSLSGIKGGKYERQIIESEHFQKMMTAMGFWIRNDTFIGHPKLEHLQQVVMNHFLDAGDGHPTANGRPPSSTRIMIFAHFRDSAEEIARVLRRNEPMIRPHVFVGQQASKGSEGMDQKRQLEVIHDFKTGKYNTLVATSIGEEGLDIGEIDLIICYDSSASPIRMLQRMGRTGRKRAGNILLLLMKGKEERSFTEAKDNYEKMQTMIADGTKFEFHEETDRRIVPKGLDPVVDQRVVEIPIENTQADLPEPKKRGKAPKRPPKKFHMPDGVRTGFTMASRMEDDDSDDHLAVSRSRKRNRTTRITEALEPIVPLDEVLLTRVQDEELFRNYQDIPCIDGQDITIERPSLKGYPQEQQRLRPTYVVKHGRRSEFIVSALQAIGGIDEDSLSKFEHYSRIVDMDTFSQNARMVSSDADVRQLPRPKGKSDPAVRKSRAAPARRTALADKAASKVRASAKTQTCSDIEEADASSPPATDPHFAVATQGIDLGSDTSGEDEIEGEPSSELRDFIVESDVEPEPDAILTSSFEANEQRRNVRPVATINRRIPEQLTRDASANGNESDDDEGDLPSLDTLVQTRVAEPEPTASKKRRANATGASEHVRRKRRVIHDSSD